MNKTAKIMIVVALLLAVGAAIVLKNGRPAGPPPEPVDASVAQPTPPTQPARAHREQPAPPPPVPRLVDIGSATCIPCKMLAPILEELSREYAGRLQVDFYDVRKDPRIEEVEQQCSRTT